MQRQETVIIRTSRDVSLARQRVRAWSAEIGFGLVDQTKLVTTASELARNAFLYAGGGTMLIEELELLGKRGLRLVFEDHGPGIADIDPAMTDRFTAGAGLSMDLELEVTSSQGEGTRLCIVRWKPQ